MFCTDFRGPCSLQCMGPGLGFPPGIHYAVQGCLFSAGTPQVSSRILEIEIMGLGRCLILGYLDIQRRRCLHQKAFDGRTDLCLPRNLWCDDGHFLRSGHIPVTAGSGTKDPASPRWRPGWSWQVAGGPTARTMLPLSVQVHS